jgi:hypothetical protein
MWGTRIFMYIEGFKLLAAKYFFMFFRYLLGDKHVLLACLVLFRIC